MEYVRDCFTYKCYSTCWTSLSKHREIFAMTLCHVSDLAVSLKSSSRSPLPHSPHLLPMLIASSHSPASQRVLSAFPLEKDMVVTINLHIHAQFSESYTVSCCSFHDNQVGNSQMRCRQPSRN